MPATIGECIFCAAFQSRSGILGSGPISDDQFAAFRDKRSEARRGSFVRKPNPPPVFGALDTEIAGPPALWNEKHLKVIVRSNGRTLVLKAWNFAQRAAELVPGSRVDIAFALEDDPFSAARGYPGWCAVLRDFRAAGQARDATVG